MSAPFTSYIVANDTLFRGAIARAQGVVSDLRIPFGLIASDFYRSEQAIFKLAGPGQYPDLNPTYAQAKERAVGFRYPILARSGRLAASVLSPSSPESVLSITPNSLTIGTTVPYAVYHQSDAPRSKIPLRKFLFIGPEAPQFATSDQMGRTERWLNIINDYVLAKIGAP